MLFATILAQFVKIWDRNLNYSRRTYDILDEKFDIFLIYAI